jgi:hypothetical protein
MMFEYWVTHSPDLEDADVRARLNELGELGWDLVSVEPVDEHWHRFCMKRPVHPVNETAHRNQIHRDVVKKLGRIDDQANS